MSDSDVDILAQQLRDYSQLGISLVWQRQVIFLAALGLAAFYYDIVLAGVVLAMILSSEFFDFFLFRRILRCQTFDVRKMRHFLILIGISTLISASVIITYAIWIATLQGPVPHFMPLFFLFAAALFASMNNHQLPLALFLRLACYGLAFLFIPVRDIVITGAPLHSELWAQLFTSIFVLFFIVECSRIYQQFYKSKLSQLKKLREEHERSKIAYKAKTEFLSTMSHELRTPLTVIKGAVDIVASGKVGEMPAKAEALLQAAQRNSERLLSLINEILDLQDIETEAMLFDFQDVKLWKTVEDAISDNGPYAAQLDVTFVATPPKNDVLVSVDEKRLAQVFSNVLSNAAKYSPVGSNVLVSMETDGDTARVLFHDSGSGLSPDNYDTVFDPFTQVDSSDTRKIGGTGLGMNISKRIMETLGGEITYRKNDGLGTTFVVELPCV
jgi:signal transduction histidine kinase